MKIRAIIFDVYGTLLEAGPPPADAEAQWRSLCLEMLGTEPRLSLLDFSSMCKRVIAQRHDTARAHGIVWPEVYWPSVVTEVVSEFAHLSQSAQDEFIFRQIQTMHSTRMSDETADILRWLKQSSLALGIASNSQAYTRRELQEALRAQALDLSLFVQDLCFWSYQHGFSKPDPHVFQIIAARLEARGIRAQEILMVGNRLENDIEPARACGWQTWLNCRSPNAKAGSWSELRRNLEKFS